MDFITYILFATGAPMTAALVPLLVCRKGFTPRLVGIMLAVSAGVLFSIATLDLLPEAIRLGLEESAKMKDMHHHDAHDTLISPSPTHLDSHNHNHDDRDGPEEGGLEEAPHHHHEDDLKIVMSGLGAGFFLLLCIEQFITSFGGGHTHSLKFDKENSEHSHGEKEKGSRRSSAFSHIALLGLGIHSFFDGLVIAGAFEASDQVGSRVAMAIILHKFPDGLVLSSLLASAVISLSSSSSSSISSSSSSSSLSSPSSSSSSSSSSSLPSPSSSVALPSSAPPSLSVVVSSSSSSPSSTSTASGNSSTFLGEIPRTSLYAVFAVCLTTPLGAFFGRAALSGIPTITLAFFLAFSAGSFLFVTTVGILPELISQHGSSHSHRNSNSLSRLGTMVSISAGYVGVVLMSSVFGHPH